MSEYISEEIVKQLLHDQTTGRNIMWATAERGKQEIQPADTKSIIPRHDKNRAHQKLRTKTRAEIFTPPDICKIQNDLVCEPFKSRTTWTEFVDAKFLEITCGEAPYITGRYDAVKGTKIPLDERVGLLDRKLREVSAQTKAPADCLEWTKRAVQSVYGYEFQGDNLFLARRNVLRTVKDFFRAKFNREPPEDFLLDVAKIISWNFWQMDGLTYSPPFMGARDLFGGANCQIKDWRTGEIFEFADIAEGRRR